MAVRSTYNNYRRPINISKPTIRCVNASPQNKSTCIEIMMITYSGKLHMIATRGVTMCNVDHLYTIWLRGCQQYIYLEQHTTICDSTRSRIVEFVEYNKYNLSAMITDKGDHHQVTCCLEGSPITAHLLTPWTTQVLSFLCCSVLDDRLWSTHDWFKHSNINTGPDRMTVA